MSSDAPSAPVQADGPVPAAVPSSAAAVAAPSVADGSKPFQHRARHGQQQHRRHRRSREDCRYLAALAVQQMEYLFSVQNLCQDTFLRSHLDSEGYMPIAIVCNFPHIAGIGAYYPDIIAALKSSKALEVDDTNETVRPRDKPHQWVFPNPAPRWIKLDTGSEGRKLQGSGPHVPRQGANKKSPRPRRDGPNRSANGSFSASSSSSSAGVASSDGRVRRSTHRSQGIGAQPEPAVPKAAPQFGAEEFPPLSATVC
eukprot:CAMPEP_0118970276 /NCGR_PEP_ID=MMETSP1173-20130426/7212_1 /TAXON_ID=1034831 /ORGANISM="Rhizochromulina marina cf, Strain CCMP1243" /LENGTH=254 /DNA_ID=CAMNT_0006919619 /DNA_START=116 /DNA_END=880 /DNA_ORIENTATION=-